MKIDKYPTVVWQSRKARIVATLQGPICEVPVIDKGETVWQPADLGKHGQNVLKAYHDLMQTTECEVPVKASEDAPSVAFRTVVTDKGYEHKKT